MKSRTLPHYYILSVLCPTCEAAKKRPRKLASETMRNAPHRDPRLIAGDHRTLKTVDFDQLITKARELRGEMDEFSMRV